MSRAELAALADDFVLEAYGRRTALDANYVGKLERGVVRWPREEYRAALRAVLGVSDDTDLGFAAPAGRPSAVVHLAGENAADGSTGAPAIIAAASLLDLMTPTPVPRRIGRTEVEQVQGAAMAFAEWDNRYGGLAREAPMAQLRWSAALLGGADCPGELWPDLLSAVGYLAHTCGFMAFDAYAFDDARRVLRFGLSCAEEADNWHLRARLLATSARLETWVGRPDDGLTHTQMALVRSDRLTATERAMLRSLEARAFGRMGLFREALTAVAMADEALTQQDVSVDPPWMAFYDAAQHAGDIGAALLDLAQADAVPARVAEARYVVAIESRPGHLVRSRALSQVGLAKLTMATGDPAEAVALSHQALDAAGPVRSRRVAADLAELSQIAQRHAPRTDVAELGERLKTVEAA